MPTSQLSTYNNNVPSRVTPYLRVGLIGDPVAHSYSPRFQQAALDALGIPARYDLWRTPAEQLIDRIRSLCQKHCIGANVTIPHKEAVLPLLDKVDPLAERIGAVNTIVHRDDYLHGYNTDAYGLLMALYENGIGEQSTDGSIALTGYTAVLLGAGGAARAAAFALAGAGVQRLIILNRSLERAQHLAADIQKVYDGPVFSLNDPAFLISHSSSIIINATSVGMHGDVSPLPIEVLSRFEADTFVFDMIYNPIQTHLLLQARTMGLRAANGLPMLLHQGALSFELWFNRPAPLDVMRTALQI
ncbi:shikimate dehydrogenase [Thermosporothrix hazakensis]|uniref:Shikimate dehydrogenase (NADP(+)) n=2 Tax=Thermosporothrix TaxID=768650 RepID=A0A326TVL1_THEHA|nr:shikimate dehydrogenase [Thermosporothrix hazakensis]PZW19516.1 shikimate dehydrogenase [Thermosporothrix hazakensis]BBH89390.1 shikimate dehydrogenase [Thermosporothrix sp. COM3]GCE47573.1 shikimate dehydrogenase [Thermosporothrix hazakensis]